MKITLKCSCGAEAEFDDPRSVFTMPGGGPDAEGFRYVIERRVWLWLAEHKGHAALGLTPGGGK